MPLVSSELPPYVGAMFAKLQSKNPDEREEAATEIRNHVVSLSQEMEIAEFQKFNNDMNKVIFGLLHGDQAAKLGGISVVDKLVDADTGEEVFTKMTRFANYLRGVVITSDTLIQRKAAKTIGRLSSMGGSLVGELVDFEVKRSIEWLQSDRQETRRHAAILQIKAIGENNPTLLYAYVGQILDNAIWAALRDPKLMIRDDAAEALRVLLDIINKRESTQKEQWYRGLFEEAQAGLRSQMVDVIHGSLLVYRELLGNAGMFMQPKYTEVCETVLRYKDHKDSLIRRTVITMLPELAKYNPTEFTKRFLVDCTAHLIGQLKKEKDRGLVFISIGKIALSVRSNMTFYLEPILENVREGLSAKGRIRKEQEGAIFQCLGMLASAVGQALAKHISREILDLIFSCGLSEPLYRCLSDLVTYIPPLQETTKDRLLDMLSLTLNGSPFHPPGSPMGPQYLMNEAAAHEFREVMIRDSPGEMTENRLIALALQILGHFNFRGKSLAEFVRDTVVSYMSHDDPKVRKSAALTACKIYVNDPICSHVSENSLRSVGLVISKLLTLAVSDPSADIRSEILMSLDSKLDPHLAQPANVRLLFVALNDEVFNIRLPAIKVIGRLTRSNPAYVIPPLRKTLMQLLTELEYSKGSRAREESASTLAALIQSSRGLVKPYAGPMVRVLNLRATDRVPTVAASAISALGELGRAAGTEVMESPYSRDMMETIISCFGESSNASIGKRFAALQTLGKVASSSGYVVDPYIDYPQLLGTLISILKGGDQLPQPIKREAVRLFGILGALDPYKYREVVRKTEEGSEERESEIPIDVKLLMKNVSPMSDDYYPTVVITTLMGLLEDKDVSMHHTKIAQAILFIFRSLGLKCVPYLSQVIPGLVRVMRESADDMVGFFFRQLALLVGVVKQHIRNYLDDIFAVIKEYFVVISVQGAILTLIDAICDALNGEFKVYIPQLLPQLLPALDGDADISVKVLSTFVEFGANLEEFVHLVIPPIAVMFENGPQSVRVAAINAVGDMCQSVNLSDMVSRIVHPLLRVIVHAQRAINSSSSSSSSEENRRDAALDTLSALCFQMGQEYAVFAEVVRHELLRVKVVGTHYNQYDRLVTKLLNGEPLPQNLSRRSAFSRRKETLMANEAVPETTSKLPVNQAQLKLSWDVSQRSTKDDWIEWGRRFGVELLRESPSHAIRACASIAVVYTPLAKELFNAAFFSCWNELYDQYKEDLVRSIETALDSANIPPETLQSLLNLAEFMERGDKRLPVDIRSFSHYAIKCHAYAKALHYKELEFIEDPTTPTIEALIGINNSLQQSDAAIGILKHAQIHHSLQLKETWYEKLQRWDEALEGYVERERTDGETLDTTLGKMRCLHALGEWEALSQLADEKWKTASNDIRRQLAPLAAAAAWGLAEWEKMDSYISVLKSESPDRSYFSSILNIHRNTFDEATKQISKARDQLVTELTALVSESYNRAYGVVVRVQMLAELEEIIQYKRIPDNGSVESSNQKMALRKTWMRRLEGCQRNVDIWQRMLKVRALVVQPQQDVTMWIKFANLCRKSGRLGLAEKALKILDNSAPSVVYAQLKYMWATGAHKEALSRLVDFTGRVCKDLGLDMGDLISQPVSDSSPDTKLLARCFLKQGEWNVSLAADWKQTKKDEVLGAYLLATNFDKTWYKAWHNWALANFEVVSGVNYSDSALISELVHDNVTPALEGFFHSIALCESKALQDTLRLLTLWFKYGGAPEAQAAMAEGIAMIRVEVWLEVTPQLISRIHQPDPTVAKTLFALLSEMGRKHPQALVYPLQVAIKSDSVSRQKAAAGILDKMRAHSALLVSQAELVSYELIRVAVLWHEQWHEGLEDASRYYFGEHNTDKMFATLEPLHAALERGPETLREVSFETAYGRDLHDAYEWSLSFRRTGDQAHLHQAWEIYYSVFRRITRQLPQLTSLDLQYVSPKLLAVHDLELAVPGTYIPGKPVIGIASFEPMFQVISSKQRPRKCTFRGSDGKRHTFLLKGHEDLRQDNLVMQLFGLVNTLLADDPECFKRHLSIQRYSATPLAPKSGLLGWAPHSDTLHSLIREYREGKLLLNIEHRIMLQMAPDYESLAHLHKIEVFTFALDNTRGQDLYRVLWLKSKSSESWLDRRTQYTRSLAVMSMVGYILGLGDRHPSNLMLDRYTGKIIHIDFGDCFEAAILRDKFPEKVPFRLTRMLTYAMEVSGIEGSFRITCEHVMELLRDNSESLMAILEAFAHDPLINWGFELPGGGKAMSSTNSVPNGTSNLGVAAITTTANIVPPLNIPEPSQPRHTSNTGAGGELDLEHRRQADIRSARATLVLRRITEKLTGNDFKRHSNLTVSQQVDKLIQQATNIENLCMHFVGWCSFW